MYRLTTILCTKFKIHTPKTGYHDAEHIRESEELTISSQWHFHHWN